MTGIEERIRQEIPGQRDGPAEQLRRLLEPEEQARLETDAELLARYVHAGDRRAIERLIRRYSPMVAAVCSLSIGSQQDAQDAFQATFLILLKSAHRIRKHTSVAAWLHGVAFRTACRLRKQARKRTIPMSTDQVEEIARHRTSIQSDPIVEVARKMELELLHRELQRLPLKYQTPLVEHYLLGFTVAEVAERMDLSVSAMEGRLRRARRQLRERLASRGLSFSVTLAGATWFQQYMFESSAMAWSNSLVDQTLATDLDAPIQDGSSIQHLSHLIQGETMMLSSKSLWLAGSTLLAIAGGLISTILPGGAANQTADSTRATTQLVASIDDQSDEETQIVQVTPQATLSQLGSPGISSTQVPAAAQGGGDDGVGQVPQAGTPQDQGGQRSPGGIGGGMFGAGGGKGGDMTGFGGDAGSYRAPVVWQQPDGETPSWARDSAMAVEQRIDQVRAKLWEPLANNLEFQDTPLSQVVSSLSEATNIDMYLNTAELELEGVDPEAPISLNLASGASLREVLRRVLGDLNLSYRVGENSLEITTTQAVEDSPTIRYYDMSYIFANGDQVTQLLRAIEHSIDPDSWLVQGGTSTIIMVGSMMIVSAPDLTHFKIEDMLRNVAKINPQNRMPFGSQYNVNPSWQYGGMGGLGGGRGGMGGMEGMRSMGGGGGMF